MRFVTLLALALAGPALAGDPAPSKQSDPSARPATPASPATPTTTPPATSGSASAPAAKVDLTAALQGWPAASQEAAKAMSAKYGPPVAATPDMIVWGQTGPWNKTIVYKNENKHNFPMPHTDVMQQWIDYKITPDKADELIAYDGSVVVDRTSGTMSARCDKEAANFLAINLAHEVVTGKLSVADARKKYGEQVMAMKAGQPAPLTEKLAFAPMTNTADPDQPLDAKAAAPAPASQNQ